MIKWVELRSLAFDLLTYIAEKPRHALDNIKVNKTTNTNTNTNTNNDTLYMYDKKKQLCSAHWAQFIQLNFLELQTPM